jgi:Ran GTPase-activating protein (RanGAP) involved in mRNA processing and transport
MGSASSRPVPPPEEEAAGAPVSPAPKRERHAPPGDGKGRLDEIVGSRFAEAVERFPAKHTGPFMSATEILNLASSAKFLRPYAREIVHLYLGTSSIERATRREVLVLKLAELRGLVNLYLRDRRLVAVVEQALKAKALRSLRRLDLMGSSIGDVGMRRLLSGYEAARQESAEDGTAKDWGLHELILRQSLLTPQGLGNLAWALNRGVLPELRVLDLSFSPYVGLDGVKALAAAMEPGGGLGKLEHLALADAGLGWAGVQALGEALLKSGCPELRVLDAMGTINDVEDQVDLPPLLLEALNKDCVPKLRELRIGMFGVDATEWLFEGLQKPCSKGLEKLHLMGIKVTDAAAEELARILRAEALESLQELHLEHAEITEKGIKLISDALQDVTAPALRSLSLDCDHSVDLSAGAFKTLGEALESGALPALERLEIQAYREGSQVFIEATRWEGGGGGDDDDTLGQSSGGSSSGADVVGGCEFLAGLLDAFPRVKTVKLGPVDEEEDGGVAAEEEDEDYLIGEDSDWNDEDGDRGDVPSGFVGTQTQPVGSYRPWRDGPHGSQTLLGAAGDLRAFERGGAAWRRGGGFR